MQELQHTCHLLYFYIIVAFAISSVLKSIGVLQVDVRYAALKPYKTCINPADQTSEYYGGFYMVFMLGRLEKLEKLEKPEVDPDICACP